MSISTLLVEMLVVKDKNKPVKGVETVSTFYFEDIESVRVSKDGTILIYFQDGTKNRTSLKEVEEILVMK